MPGSSLNRRNMIRLTAGASASLLVGERALAQAGDSINILGVPVPSDLARKVLPAKPFNMVRTIAAIMALERKIKALALPYSPLEDFQPPPLVPSEDGFYLSAVPRLVTIIDKSETTDPATADEAAELLSAVNAEQRVVPDALKETPLVLSRGHDFATLKREYTRQFASVKVRDEFAEALAWHAKLAQQSRDKYEVVAKETQVPWFFIAAIHTLEASCNFRAHLHNGDFPLTRRTRQVPAGRPLVWLPPSDWASSARDALRLLGFTNQSDWSLERTLYRLEAYNGFGYRKRGVATPYLWCMSNHYERGKFVADGKWNAAAKSQQCGSAVLIKALVDAGTVKFG
jgi:lysozyme family protein